MSKNTKWSENQQTKIFFKYLIYSYLYSFGIKENCRFDSHPRYLKTLTITWLSGFLSLYKWRKSDGFEIKNDKITTLKLQDLSSLMDKFSHKFSKGPNPITSKLSAVKRNYDLSIRGVILWLLYFISINNWYFECCQDIWLERTV